MSLLYHGHVIGNKPGRKPSHWNAWLIGRIATRYAQNEFGDLSGHYAGMLEIRPRDRSFEVTVKFYPPQEKGSSHDNPPQS